MKYRFSIYYYTFFIYTSNTLDAATIVKLTRTLAIIPIILVLAFYRSHKVRGDATSMFSFHQVFPFFIIFFIFASIITTTFHLPVEITHPLKDLNKFFIVMAMSAIGLNTNIVKMFKTGGNPIFMGLCCWIAITIVYVCNPYYSFGN